MKKILLLFHLAIYSASISSQGLVAYYPFNGNANDESGNGNNGTVYGATLTTDRGGNENSAYSFNGLSDYIQTTQLNPIDTTYINQISLSVWFNCTTAEGDFHKILESSCSLNNDFICLLNNDVWAGLQGIYSSIGPYENGQWHHIVYLFDGTNTKLYVNGNLEVTNSAPGNFQYPPPLWIGVDGFNNIQHFNGKIDDIRIYNRALDSLEIQNLFNEIVPVELVSFVCKLKGSEIILSWITATETNNFGFQVERKSADENYTPIGFIQGKGTTSETQTYEFADCGLSSGIYVYRLKQVDFNGSYEYSPAIEVEIGLPIELFLNQNYPNPFNPNTKIKWQSPVSGIQTLKIYDVLGNEVATLVDDFRNAGSYEINFDGSKLSSGVYFYQLKVGGFLDTKKMILLK
jgi:hypothetical protein